MACKAATSWLIKTVIIQRFSVFSLGFCQTKIYLLSPNPKVLAPFSFCNSTPVCLDILRSSLRRISKIQAKTSRPLYLRLSRGRSTWLSLCSSRRAMTMWGMHALLHSRRCWRTALSTECMGRNKKMQWVLFMPLSLKNWQLVTELASRLRRLL